MIYVAVGSLFLLLGGGLLFYRSRQNNRRVPRHDHTQDAVRNIKQNLQPEDSDTLPPSRS